MKKLYEKKFVVQAALLALALLGAASCTVNPTSPVDGGSNIAMRTQLDAITIHSATRTPQEGGAPVDSLQITSAAFAASNFMLRSDLTDDSNHAEGDIRPPQFLLGFDISGRQYIGENIIYASTYLRAKFNIHPLHGTSDSLAPALGPLYTSLFRDGNGIDQNTTIVIRGYIWQSGIQIPFTYHSSFTGSGNVFFDQPLVVTPGSPMEVLVRFSSQTAFTDATGMILDPRDGRNAAMIETNITTALKASVNSSGS